MDYRISRILLFIPVCVLALVMGCSDSRKSPDVIVITLDTTRADYLGCYGNTYVKTPNIDALAEDSVLFENCFSASNTTRPSHTSIFTSLYPAEHGVLSNRHLLANYTGIMPKVFKARGYTSAAFCSTVNFEPRWSNIQQGYDHFTVVDNDSKSVRSGQTNEEVFEWLDKRPEGPVFMWVHYFDPHLEYNPPAPYATMYTKDSDQTGVKELLSGLQLEKNSEYFSRSDDPEHYRDLYRGEVSYMDEQLGRLVAKLVEAGMYEDSIIVVVADHGESLGEHGIYFAHPYLYDQVTRVPLLVKAPGGRFKGRRKQLVSSLDIYPTVLGLAGAEPCGRIDGVDLRKILESEDAGELRQYALTEDSDDISFCVRSLGYKLIEYEDTAPRQLFRDSPPVIKGRRELYDMRADADESHNLSGTLPAVEDRLAAEMAVLRSGASGGPQRQVKDKEFTEKLKALGYVQ